MPMGILNLLLSLLFVLLLLISSSLSARSGAWQVDAGFGILGTEVAQHVRQFKGEGKPR